MEEFICNVDKLRTLATFPLHCFPLKITSCDIIAILLSQSLHVLLPIQMSLVCQLRRRSVVLALQCCHVMPVASITSFSKFMSTMDMDFQP